MEAPNYKIQRNWLIIINPAAKNYFKKPDEILGNDPNITPVYTLTSKGKEKRSSKENLKRKRNDSDEKSFFGFYI